MSEVCLIVEFYADNKLSYAELYDEAGRDDEFVYTDKFKVRVSDTSIIPEEKIKTRRKMEARVIIVDDSIGKADSRFMTA